MVMVLKKYYWKTIRQFIKVSVFWLFIEPIIQFFKNIEKQKIALERKPHEKLIINDILKNPVVQNGPFKGLVYENFVSAGSSIFPKFIGSYEKELEPIINEICNNNYNIIIDVGCAEGYYANGFALKMPNSKIYAFDTDERAQTLCKKIAALNNLSDRVVVNSTLSAEKLDTFPFEQKNLIFCDCEGYEKELFNTTNLQNLKNCDILIETHDLFNPTISNYLINLFKTTHQTPISIFSLDDVLKPIKYNFEATKNLSYNTKKILFAEKRLAQMEWLFFKCN